eukprot:3726277-Amphidinium_carterae.1
MQGEGGEGNENVPPKQGQTNLGHISIGPTKLGSACVIARAMGGCAQLSFVVSKAWNSECQYIRERGAEEFAGQHFLPDASLTLVTKRLSSSAGLFCHKRFWTSRRARLPAFRKRSTAPSPSAGLKEEYLGRDTSCHRLHGVIGGLLMKHISPVSLCGRDSTGLVECTSNRLREVPTEVCKLGKLKTLSLSPALSA